jgi:dTDP-4-amino-4,6-dideoxygalactose transaminase
LGDRIFAQPDVDGNYALYLCASDAEAAGVQAQLSKMSIDSRFWYDRGLHCHRHFSKAPHDNLPVTELLGQRLIGLPMAPDLEEKAIRRIVEAVNAGVVARSHLDGEIEGRVSPTE